MPVQFRLMLESPSTIPQRYVGVKPTTPSKAPYTRANLQNGLTQPTQTAAPHPSTQALHPAVSAAGSPINSALVLAEILDCSSGLP